MSGSMSGLMGLGSNGLGYSGIAPQQATPFGAPASTPLSYLQAMQKAAQMQGGGGMMAAGQPQQPQSVLQAMGGMNGISAALKSMGLGGQGAVPGAQQQTANPVAGITNPNVNLDPSVLQNYWNVPANQYVP